MVEGLSDALLPEERYLPTVFPQFCCPHASHMCIFLSQVARFYPTSHFPYPKACWPGVSFFECTHCTLGVSQEKKHNLIGLPLVSLEEQIKQQVGLGHSCHFSHESRG